MVEISVVIPTYNSENTIGRAIESVLRQDHLQIEIIVVDDGSTDNIRTIIDRYKDKITFINQSNKGAGAARNAGIREARGEYIAFLDADDEWLENKLSTQLQHLNGNPEVVLVGTGAIFFDNSGVVQRITSISRRGYIFKELLLNNIITTSSVLVRKDALLALDDIFRVDLPINEDWDLWIRLSCREQFLLLPQILVKNYILPARRSISRDANFIGLQYRNKIEELQTDPYLGTYVYQHKRQLIANSYIIQGYKKYIMHDVSGARKDFIRGISLYPNYPKLIKVLSMLIVPPNIYRKVTNIVNILKIKPEKSLRQNG